MLVPYADQEARSTIRGAAISAALRERAGEASATRTQRRCRRLLARVGPAGAAARTGRRGRPIGTRQGPGCAGAVVAGKAGSSGALDSRVPPVPGSGTAPHTAGGTTAARARDELCGPPRLAG